MIGPADETAAATQTAPPHESGGVATGGELVLMTHGIASTRFLLVPLAARLRRAGFSTKLYGYPSLWWSNRAFGKRLAAQLHRLADRYERVHLVVHSMGGIVARCALEEDLPNNFGRVVQIAPPNRGSHMASRLAVDSAADSWQAAAWHHLVVKPHRFIAPTLVELTDEPGSFVNRLGPPPAGVEVGVLAASHDNVLYPEQTHLEGQTDHCVVRGWHTGVLWSKETATLTERFLRTGRFDSEASR